MRRFLWIAVAAAPVFAQPTAAPTNEPVGAPRGQNIGVYNVMNSFETGYRFRSVGGDLGKYRSDVNFGNGLRVLGSTLSVNTREGRGHAFDEILLATQGLGNDPYQSATLRIQKNKLYRYDLLWRANDYFNPAAAIALGQHQIDTTRLMQDHDFILYPQSAYQLFVGYSRNTQTGPALSTTNIGDHTGDEFTLFDNVRRRQNQYRIGGQAQLAGFRLNVLKGWEEFEEDSPFQLSNGTGANTADRNTLTSYAKREPYRGSSPFWRVALFREQSEKWAFNGRFTYTDGQRNFTSDETLLGAGRFGAFNRQIVSFGDARRPVATGNVTVSLFPMERLTLTNHTSISNVRMDGGANYREVVDGILNLEQVQFRYLGIRMVSNATDASIQVTRSVGVVAGYQMTDRNIHTRLADGFFGGDPVQRAYEQSNRVHAGRLGLRIRPNKPLSITLDSEVGRADQPIYPTSDRNYHVLGGRIQYKTRNWQLAMYTRANYNFNSTNITSFSSRARNYGLDGSWNVNPNVMLSGGYAKLHADTLSGILFFAQARQQSGLYAYLSNVHSIYLNAHASIRKRVELLFGLSRTEDTGDGKSRGGALFLPGAANPFANSAETFPMAFTSPMARVSLKLHTRLRWNAAYQYYGFRQDFATRIIPNQGYRAHTGYTSLSWAF